MTVSDYIQKMADASKTEQHEVILECLEHFDVLGTADLSLEQAAEFWEMWRNRQWED